ncbi:hypothetical protein GGR56DRAFT_317452 [Xylariaceae sp. FL0804]|nr:hypothetical protein GGR56DRAFT_317452 [Xylariaceae sp. FL0804]
MDMAGRLRDRLLRLVHGSRYTQRRGAEPLSSAVLDEKADALSFIETVNKIFCSSYLHFLLPTVLIGVVAHHLHMVPVLVFTFNALAIVPLSSLLAYATECIAADLGDAVGALMNVSFGNLIEILMFFAALARNHIKVVQGALVGSILVNLLLILGSAILAGELQPQDLVYNIDDAQALACLLALSIFSILIPMAFHFSFSDEARRERAVMTLSRASSITLLVVYFIYLFFLLRSRRQVTASPAAEKAEEDDDTELPMSEVDGSDIYATEEDAPRHSRQSDETRSRPPWRTVKFADDRTSPSPLPSQYGSVDETPRESREETRGLTRTLEDSEHQSERDNVQRWIRGAQSAQELRRIGSAYRTSRRRQSGSRSRSRRRSMSADLFGTSYRLRTSNILVEAAAGLGGDGGDGPAVSRAASVVVLVASSLATAFCADYLMASVEAITAATVLTPSFIGLVVLSVVGNAAEYITAVKVAARGKLDLALGVSFGSSIQIALFVSPLMVIAGWVMDKDMTLYLGLFETSALVGAAFLVNFVIANGKTNYLEGTMLCACYVMVGIGAYLTP